jgi:hypothetical protein
MKSSGHEASFLELVFGQGPYDAKSIELKSALA